MFLISKNLWVEGDDGPLRPQRLGGEQIVVRQVRLRGNPYQCEMSGGGWVERSKSDERRRAIAILSFQQSHPDPSRGAGRVG